MDVFCKIDVLDLICKLLFVLLYDYSIIESCDWLLYVIVCILICIRKLFCIFSFFSWI